MHYVITQCSFLFVMITIKKKDTSRLNHSTNPWQCSFFQPLKSRILKVEKEEKPVRRNWDTTRWWAPMDLGWLLERMQCFTPEDILQPGSFAAMDRPRIHKPSAVMERDPNAGGALLMRARPSAACDPVGSEACSQKRQRKEMINP